MDARKNRKHLVAGAALLGSPPCDLRLMTVLAWSLTLSGVSLTMLWIREGEGLNLVIPTLLVSLLGFISGELLGEAHMRRSISRTRMPPMSSATSSSSSSSDM